MPPSPSTTRSIATPARRSASTGSWIADSPTTSGSPAPSTRSRISPAFPGAGHTSARASISRSIRTSPAGTRPTKSVRPSPGEPRCSPSAAVPWSTSRRAGIASAASSIGRVRRGVARATSGPARAGLPSRRATRSLHRVLERRRHGEREHLDALLRQVGRLAWRRFAADRPRRGLVVMDATRFLRKAPADILGRFDELAGHVHPQALRLELAPGGFRRLRRPGIACRSVRTTPVDPGRRQQLADLAAAADRALDEPLLHLLVEILATAEPALEDVVLLTTEIEDFHRRGSTPHGHAFMIPHA